jgi:hypothetical protein
VAKGSHTSFGAYDPRVCSICGQPIRITGPRAIWFHHDSTGHYAWHIDCKRQLPWRP